MKSCLIAAAMALPLSGMSQIQIVKKGKPATRIVVTTAEQADSTAAVLLQDFVKRITKAELPVVFSSKSQVKEGKKDILIGNGMSNAPLVTSALTEDGFMLTTEDGRLRILNGGDKGSIYGVVTLLEKYAGVNYWGENEYSLTPSADLTLPQLRVQENPDFRYRQSQFYGMWNEADPIYRLWMRLDEPKDYFAGGYWVHTFNRLLPADVYGKEHPEYYAYFNGQRHPGRASQWCLTNPEILEIVAARVDSIFKAHPECHTISVSQNDSQSYCQCDKCRAINAYEGAPSGTIIHFLNKLAERFPDKEFSTLAYLYSVNPPKHVKPLPNVNIMLCDIDCCREVTLTENASGQEFVKAMEGWSSKTNNIFVWDYGINFDNYLVPFPNFHIMAENMRLFKKNHTQMHFYQDAGSRGGDFAEMRTWLASKLMWNTEADIEELLQTFINGYYGEAAPYIYRYVKMVEGALMGSGQRLWIYDSPVSHKYGMLKTVLLNRYKALFDQAEEAVKNDSTHLARVQRSRLPLLYSELEIERTNPEKNFADLTQKLNYFEKQVKRFDVPTLNERSNSPVEYCELYRQRYMPRSEKNLAAGATIEYLEGPHARYAQMAETALTDGLFGGQSFTESWIGWEGTDGSFVIDLGQTQEISSIETDFLHQLGQWILLPRGVKYEISTDGENYTLAGDYPMAEDSDYKVKFVSIKHSFPTKQAARYIRVSVTGTKICPHWHYGVGNPCWFFVDEVTVL